VHNVDFSSSFWSDVDMMINYFTDVPKLNRKEILLYLNNTKKQGYELSQIKVPKISCTAKTKVYAQNIIANDKCTHFTHNWSTVKDDYILIYEECKNCKSRRVLQYIGTELSIVQHKIYFDWLFFKTNEIEKKEG
jgi:hypothetical protein